jgi:hypothetical protein
MQVYVVETDTVYQYTITGFTSLWNAAEAAGSIHRFRFWILSVTDDTPQGVAFS